MLEILAPSGSKENFYAAINGGADAVYLGLDDFSARKNADNFTKDNLKEHLQYAHVLGVKVYVALNTLVKDGELPKFFDYLEFLNDVGADGVILQEILLADEIKKRFPDLPLHLSTQAGLNNIEGAILAKNLGFSRVVLARETPLEDIREISKIIETEVFVQGALCTSFSGQCYLSGFAGNKSGNRGLCKQPCRKKYALFGKGVKKEGYLISLSDLSVGHKIHELLDAGVSSFKIEGRMRKGSFVSAAVEYYKGILEGKSPSISRLKRTFNRGDFTNGLAFSQDGSFLSSIVQGHLGEEVGTVSKVLKDSVLINSSHKIKSGDGFKVLRQGLEVGSLIADKSGALRGQGDIKVGDKVNVTTDVSLEEELLLKKRSLPVKVKGRFLKGERAVISLSAQSKTVEFMSEEVLEESVNRPVTKEELEQNLEKVDNYPFSVSCQIETDGVFIPKSKLNGYRREAFKRLFEELSKTEERRKNSVPFDNFVSQKVENGLVVLSNTFEGVENLKMDIAVFCPDDYLDKDGFERFFRQLKNNPAKKFLYLFGKQSSEDNRLIAPLLEKFDGIYADGFYGVELGKKLDKELMLGSGCNVYNDLSLKKALTYTPLVALSKEIAFFEAKNKDEGYYYSLGSIKVMDLNYCPFEKKCPACKGEREFILSDGERNFRLRRVSMSECRFEVYNSANLITDFKGRRLVNLIALSKEERQNFVKYIDEPKKIKEIYPNATGGHYKRSLE